MGTDIKKINNTTLTSSTFEYSNLTTTKIENPKFLNMLFEDRDPVLFIKNINLNRMYKHFVTTNNDNKDIYLYIDQNDLAKAKIGNLRFTYSGRFTEVIYGGQPFASYEDANTKVVSLKFSNENKKYSIPMDYKHVLIKTSNNKLFVITQDQFNSLLETFITLGLANSYEGYWIELRDTKDDLTRDLEKGYDANVNAIHGMKNIHLVGTEIDRHSPEYIMDEEAEVIEVEVLDKDEYIQEKIDEFIVSSGGPQTKKMY